MATTLTQITDGAKDLADLVGDPHVPQATWTRWANRGQEKLWRKLAASFQDLWHATQDFTLVGGAAGNSVAMNAAVRQIRGLSKDPTSPSLRRTVHPRNFDERDDQNALTYDALGLNLVLEPFEYSAGVYRLYYVAGPTALVNVGDNIDTQLEPFVEYVETYMAIKAAGKEEGDSVDLRQDLKDLWDEIEGVCMNRDAAVGETIVDVERTGGARLWLP